MNRMEERKKLGEQNLLPQSILMETSKVYSDIAEKITGEKIVLSENPKEEIIKILDEKYGLISKGEKRKAPLAVIAAGSDSDMPHLETLKKELAKFKIDSEIRICSAHKQPSRLQNVIAEYSKNKEPIALVGCAGGTDALSGTASYLANFPVVSCPPEASKSEVNKTCLTNPPGSSNAYILRPANVAKFAAQMFARSSKAVAAALDANIAEKITKLESADEQLAMKRRLEVGEDAGQCGA